MKKLVVRLLICYVAMVAAMVALMTLAHCIPADLTARNADASIEFIGKHPGVIQSRFYSFDTFTDRVMVEEVKNIDSAAPLRSAMISTYKYFMWFPMAADEIALARADGGEDVVYARYWHGYTIFLAPLLIFFNYSIIRWLNFAIALILMCIVGYLLVKRKGWLFTACFMLPILYIGYPYEALCMQYMSAFCVMMLTVIAVNLTAGKASLTPLFFISGGMLAFVDFLTYPMLALCYPLVVAVALNSGNNREKFRLVVALTLAWGIGYASIWASKWVIAQIVTGLPIFSNALAALLFRSSNSNTESFFLMFRIFSKGIFFPGDVWIAVAALAVVAAIICRRAVAETIRRNAPYIAVGCIPILWFIVVRNHSLTLFLFTWRALAPTMFVILLLTVSFFKTLRCRK